MSTNNIKIYDIFRKDLHLDDEKAKELVSEMDEVFCKESIKDLATKTEVKELSGKVDELKAQQDGFNIQLEKFKDKINELQIGFATFKAEMATQMKTDFEKFYSKMDKMSLLQYIAITGTIVGILCSLGVFKYFLK